MKSTRIPGVHYWSHFQPDRGIDFNGFFVEDPAGGVLIDPLPLPDACLARLRELGGVRTILVTNADHVRAAEELKSATGARILAPEPDRELLGDLAVDDWFESSDDLPPGMSLRWKLAWLRGGKRPLEAAFWLETQRAWYFGDAVRCHESGRLRLLPDQKIADRTALVASIRALSGRDVQAILLGDGDCIFNGARDAFEAFNEGI